MAASGHTALKIELAVVMSESTLISKLMKSSFLLIFSTKPEPGDHCANEYPCNDSDQNGQEENCGQIQEICIEIHALIHAYRRRRERRVVRLVFARRVL